MKYETLGGKNCSFKVISFAAELKKIISDSDWQLKLEVVYKDVCEAGGGI